MSHPPPLDRDATAVAYARHRRVHEAGDWEGLGALFAEDARYFDPFFGWHEGQPAIAAFLRRSMAGLEGWTFPIQWHVAGEGRVVVRWLNRLPGRRPDGSPFEFPGMSVITFGPGGAITEQQDLYDRFEALQTVLGARTGAVGRAAGWCWSRVGAILAELSHRAVASSERR
ncbi:MAG: hypothetical protein AMXMBFR64_31480 [Myxococcales bacterium]